MALAAWCVYLLYQYAAGAIASSRPEVVMLLVPVSDQILRALGLLVLVGGAVVLYLRRPVARYIVLIGLVIYLAPWLYRYLQATASQSKADHVLFTIVAYPFLTWSQLFLPISMLVLTIFSFRRPPPADPTAETDARKGGARAPGLYVRNHLPRVFAILFWTLVIMVALHLPLVQIPLLLLAYPLLYVFPELQKTGAHVEVTLFYIGLRSAFAYGAYTTYFLVLVTFMHVLIVRLRKVSQKEENADVTPNPTAETAARESSARGSP